MTAQLDPAGDHTLETLTARVPGLEEQYLAAKPWPHLVLENVFPDDLLDAAAAECAGLDPSKLVVSHEDRQVKEETPDGFGPACTRLLELLDGDVFRQFLTDVTGVPHLLADPTHKLAGVHRTPVGGFTKIHRDFRLHPVNGLYHRVNVLVYLNRDWLPEYGGDLEMWPADMSAMGKTVRPTFNTMVLWETHDLTLHGLPDPVNCPADRRRLSVAAYYYTAEPPALQEERRRIGYWEARPGEERSIARLTWQDQLRRIAPRSLRVVGRKARARIKKARARHGGSGTTGKDA